MSLQETSRSERIELILHQLQSLPTLSMIAARLLTLTSSDDSEIQEIVEVIESDPALTTRILALCRRAEKGLSSRITTIDRSVVLLGIEAIRNAVLSLEIYGLFKTEDDSDGGDGAGGGALESGFDRVAFWKHSIGVAVASELIARLDRKRDEINPHEAFVAGLLHDLGKLGLDRVLPRSYARVVELAETQMGNIADFERKIIGIDHHTAGKRLAEQWQLPHVLQDVIWLHGHPYESLPALPHRRMIGIVSLANMLVRSQHIGFSGNQPHNEDWTRLCALLELEPTAVAELIPQLHAGVAARTEALGLDEVLPEQLLLESIAQANAALGRINESHERWSSMARKQDQVLRAISDFHQGAAPGQSVVSVAGSVVASAAREFGIGFYAVLCPSWNESQWQMCQFSSEGQLLRSQIVEPPIGSDGIESFFHDHQISVGMLSLLPWLSDYIGDAQDVRQVSLLPLRCGWGLSAILLHDRDPNALELSRSQLTALCATWAASLAAAGQHEGAKRLGEQLAESNRALTEAQSKLAQSQLMASLGELAAGAAHEMNNPLCVISGRSQVLANELTDPGHRRMAEQISDQAHRMSDLITSLHLFADPPEPERQEVRLDDVIGRAVTMAKERCPSAIPINVNLPSDLPLAWIDSDQVAQALFELIVNALEADPNSFVDVDVQMDPKDGRLVIGVKDDGVGMSAHALVHAFDPFFSEKPAGRQPGLGLARARRLVDLHGGMIDLDSTAGQGMTARIELRAWQRKPGEITPEGPAEEPGHSRAA